MQQGNFTKTIPLPALSGRALSLSALRVGSSRLLGPVSALVLAIVLTNTLGASASGIFFASVAMVSLLAVAAKAGLETALQKLIGREQGTGNRALVRGIYWKALRISAFLALIITGCGYLLAGKLSVWLFNDPSQTAILQIMTLLVIPLTLLGINAAALKAVGNPAQGSFLESSAWPLISIVVVTGYLLHAPGGLTGFAIASVVAAWIAVVVSFLAIHQVLDIRNRSFTETDRGIFSICVPLLGVELINFAMIWVPLITLPLLADTSEAGLYSIAQRLGAQLAMLMLVFASITSPQFAAHFHNGRQSEVVTLAARTTRRLLAFALLPAAILLLWPEPVLGIFGEEFTHAATALRILVVGQLFHLLTGPSGYLLAMSGHEKALNMTLVLSLLCLILLLFILSPDYGASGAALAATTALVLNKLMCVFLAARHLQVPLLLVLAR